jgi:hypothetical protein
MSSKDDIIYSVPSSKVKCPKSHSDFKVLVPADIFFEYEMTPEHVIRGRYNLAVDYDSITLDKIVIKSASDDAKLKKLLSLDRIETVAELIDSLEDTEERTDDDYKILQRSMRDCKGSEEVYMVVNVYVSKELLL